MTVWMVRAGRGGVLYDSFMDRGEVSVGWAGSGDVSPVASREELRANLVAGIPDLAPSELAAGVSVLWRFAHEMREGEPVLTYDPDARVYRIGRIAGPYRFDAAAPEIIDASPYPHLRPVLWRSEIPRDGLSAAARNTLGSISTLFRVRGVAELEILARLAEAEGVAPPALAETDAEEIEASDAASEVDPRSAVPPTAQDLADQAVELVKDRVAGLSPDAMEEFVAGLLRALGYRTIVSPRGPDRGRDILATPDPLGLEDPRIHVEVKHRRGKADTAMLRGFLGGRGPGDRGVFVSTGGFTREAEYEADRAAIPMRLMTLDDLVRVLLAHYDALDTETRAMVPLRRLHWPL